MILMDLMTPVMDGLEAARTIRNMQREDAASATIIAMTANSFNDDVENCRKPGMNEHLSKLLDFGKPAETIKKYINSK